jgi:hypothetical protein
LLVFLEAYHLSDYIDSVVAFVNYCETCGDTEFPRNIGGKLLMDTVDQEEFLE